MRCLIARRAGNVTITFCDATDSSNPRRSGRLYDDSETYETATTRWSTAAESGAQMPSTSAAVARPKWSARLA